MSDFIPPELIVKILLNLPVKSLIRFTAVCKSWQSVITSPSFISSHLDKPKNQTILLQRNDPSNHQQEHLSLLEISEKNSPFCIISSSELEIPFKSQFEDLIVVGSCRGIVCLSDMRLTRLKRAVLWNPCVKKHLFLPNCIINPTEDCGCVLGFGVSDSNDFKVVRLVYYRKPDGIGFDFSASEAEVFSLRTGRWRKLIGIDIRFQVVPWSHVFLNGAVHWRGYYKLDNGRQRCSVLSFRVEDEVFDEITLPYELAKEHVCHLSLTSIGESLAMIKYKDRGSYDVWLMKEYGVESSWTKWYTSLSVEGVMKIVALQKNGEALVASRNKGLVAFDLALRKTRNLGIHDRSNVLSYVDNYVESLELLKCESENCKEVQGAEEDMI